jgi:hypothetical protein
MPASGEVQPFAALSAGNAAGCPYRFCMRSARPKRQGNRIPPGRRWLLTRALWAATILGAWAGSPAPAGSSGGVSVGATVRPYARVESASTPGALTLSAADVARGYVDVRDGGTWVVKTNASSYVLEIEVVGAGDWIVAVEARGLGPERVFAPPRGRLARSRAGSGILDVVEPGWRIHLGEAARPGSYPWPLRLDVGGASASRLTPAPPPA